MTSRRLQECIEEFIEIYRNEPCLWQIKCKDYHDRARREAAYSKLVEKLKEVEPSANKESVVKKINNIRSNYRKELKKVKASSKTGSGTDDIYEPKLWYFKLLCFLNDQDIPRKSRTNIESDNDETRIELPDLGSPAGLSFPDSLTGRPQLCTDDFAPDRGWTASWISPSVVGSPMMDQEYDIGITSGKSVPDGSIEDADESPVCTKDENSSEPAACTSASTPQYNRPRPSKRNLSSDQEALTNDVLLSINNHFKRPANQDDRFDIFGKNVAMKLRDLPKQQRLIAEKIINETLFEAEMGNLTMSQGLTYQHQHQLHTINPTPPPMYQQYQQ
ncbi:uncharacterized protein LOC112459340 [Temnothorax curvispinosus]|uniref:Uncharacterized protein LOC112459340 n=1 Tax=Temnothorax curvispinosus TaxID=300111 RepID=A0A6J1QEL3_9HYME|nr:uncharacterized protein LOC112459340 [Temnothorax curvispinosus]